MTHATIGNRGIQHFFCLVRQMLLPTDRGAPYPNSLGIPLLIRTVVFCWYNIIRVIRIRSIYIIYGIVCWVKLLALLKIDFLM